MIEFTGTAWTEIANALRAPLALATAIALALSIIPCCREFLPLSVRVAVAFAVSLVGESTHTVQDSLLVLLHCSAIAIPIAFACESLSTAGRLIDIARGAQFAEQLLPGMSQTSLLELFAKLVALYWILAVEWELLFSALLTPVSAAGTLTLESSTAWSLPALFAQSFYAGLYFAAPLLALSLLADAGGMCVSKLAPKLPVAFELLPLKLVLILGCASARLLNEPTALVQLRQNTVASFADGGN